MNSVLNRRPVQFRNCQKSIVGTCQKVVNILTCCGLTTSVFSMTNEGSTSEVERDLAQHMKAPNNLNKFK